MRTDRLALLTLLGYLALLAVLTLRPVGAGVDSDVRINLEPFETINRALRRGPGSFGFATLVGNLLAFVPLGLLLPICFRRLHWLGVIAAGALLSIAIESAQLGLSLYLGFGYRSADIDDVIVNVTGTIVGLALFAVASLASAVLRRDRSAG